MHDRGDYKSGWQLEKEWEQDQERKQKMMLGEKVEEEENYEIREEDDLPWAWYAIAFMLHMCFDWVLLWCWRLTVS